MQRLLNPAAVKSGKFPTTIITHPGASPSDLRDHNRRSRITEYLKGLNVIEITLMPAFRKQHHRMVEPELWIKTQTSSIILSIDYLEFKVKDLKISPNIAPPEKVLSLDEIDALVKSGGRSIQVTPAKSSVVPPKSSERKVHGVSRAVHVLSTASLLPPKEVQQPEPEPLKPLSDGIPGTSIPTIADLLVGQFGMADIKTAVEMVCGGEPSQGQLQQAVRRLKEDGFIEIIQKGVYRKVTTTVIPADEVTRQVIAEPTKPVPPERIAEIISDVAEVVRSKEAARVKQSIDLTVVRDSLRREKEAINRKQALIEKVVQRTALTDDVRAQIDKLQVTLGQYQEGLNEDLAELKSLGLDL